MSKIYATFINRITGEVTAEQELKSDAGPLDLNPFGNSVSSLNPFSAPTPSPPSPFGGVPSLDELAGSLIPSPPPVKRAPIPSTINYQTDLTRFTDAFEFTLEFSKSEDFKIGSHDFVEFSIELEEGGKLSPALELPSVNLPLPDLPGAPGIPSAPGLPGAPNVPALPALPSVPEISNPIKTFKRHQIGVGFIEQFQKVSQANRVTLQANGRDLFGQFLFVPFKKTLRNEPLTLSQFCTEQLIKDSYLSRYLELRQSDKSVIKDRGSFSVKMGFFSDLEQKKGQILQKYANLAINLVYMNRLGQIEIYGRPGTVGSTAGGETGKTRGVLSKGLGEGESVIDFTVQQNYTNVFSRYQVFYLDAEGQLDQSATPSEPFLNSDPRVSNIENLGYSTFQFSDLIAFGGNAKLNARIRDLAKAAIRQSNRSLNTVIATVADPHFFETTSRPQVAYEIGQKFSLKSVDREFTSRSQPGGTDNVEMVLIGISYVQTPEAVLTQLKFVEPDTVV